jgi:hypothetical protein
VSRLVYRLLGPSTSRRQVLLWTLVGAAIYQLSKDLPDFVALFDWAYISAVALGTHWCCLELRRRLP